VSFRITGVFQEEDNQLKLISPIRKLVGSNLYAVHQLESGGTYHLKVVVHLPYRSPAALPGQGQATLKLDFNSDLIKILGPTRLRITSFYDLEYWSFIVTTTEKQKTALNLTCEYDINVDRSEFQRTELLCPEISLPIAILSPEPSRQAGGQ
jgi:hypothetical protein